MMHSEKGLSLVELLGGIVLLSIVTTLTTIILVNTFDTKDTTAKEITLKQDTNLMVSALRKEFFDESRINENEQNKEICFSNQSDKVKVITNENKDSEAETASYSNNGVIKEKDGQYCLVDFSYEKPVEINLYTKNNDNKTIHISTVLPRRIFKGDEPLVIEDFCDIESLKKLNIKSEKTLPCLSKGPFIWTGDSIDNKSCSKIDRHTINGNLIVTGSKSQVDDADIRVNGNACFLGEFQFHSSSSFFIRDNAQFKKKTEIQNGSTLVIGNDALFKTETQIQQNSTLIVGNSLIHEDKDFEIQSGASLYVNKDAKFHNLNSSNSKHFCVDGTVNSQRGANKADKENCIYPDIPNYLN